MSSSDASLADIFGAGGGGERGGGGGRGGVCVVVSCCCFTYHTLSVMSFFLVAQPYLTSRVLLY